MKSCRIAALCAIWQCVNKKEGEKITEGQLSIFDILPKRKINEKNECLGEPCKYCDVEWCSLICFIRRGYIWDKVNRFIRDENGEYFRRKLENRECKKVYGDKMQSKNGTKHFQR